MGIDQGKALVRVVATFRISHFTPGPAAAAVVEKFGFKTGRNWQKSRERKISLRFGGTCSNFQRERDASGPLRIRHQPCRQFTRK